MKFYTSFSEDRPIRLSEQTRNFAMESLSGIYGREALDTPSVKLPFDLTDRTDLDAYDAAIEAIVRTAPLRVCPKERISGAATYGDAIRHLIPAKFKNGQFLESVSHLTVDFFEILNVGYNGIRERARRCASQNTDTSKARFYQSVLHCLDCFELYHKRYLELLSGMPEHRETYLLLQRVPAERATTFKEAVQSLWFTFSFIRLCGNWPGFGRLDVLLGDYLRKDLKTNAITLEEAREFLAHFFIKGCEWINGIHRGSGDAQHYQNIVLSGIDEDGNDVTNEISYLVLDIIEELPIGDFPVTVRVNRNTDPAFLRKVAQTIRFGGGVVAIYNEELILSSLTGYGYPEKEARRFANDGCWEVQIPGHTMFNYIPFDALEVLQQAVSNYEKTDFPTFDDLYGAYLRKMRERVSGIEEWVTGWMYDKENDRFAKRPACTVVSLFEQDCIGKGLSYFEGGPDYTVISPHIGGVADVVNSLYAIKKMVYDDGLLTLPELFSALRDNWEGREDLRRYALTHYRYFGNDNAEVDAIYRRLIDDFAECCKRHEGETQIRFPGGISTFGRQIEWSSHRLATAFGKKAGDILAGNASPTPGTDYAGVTSVIRSYCAADLAKTVTGAALDIQLPAGSVSGNEGLDALAALIRGFVTLGGYFVQFDIADAKLLREAQKHPEQYQTLSVRVSGWNARFATLNKDWQEMVIERAEGHS